MPGTHLQALSNAQTIHESKGRSIIAFPDTYCVIDVETKERSPQWDHIIEVAALKILPETAFYDMLGEELLRGH